jgi:hypothetical protein
LSRYSADFLVIDHFDIVDEDGPEILGLSGSSFGLKLYGPPNSRSPEGTFEGHRRYVVPSMTIK